MGSRQAIYNDIAASTSVFFRPRQKNSLGQGRALGNFFASDEKKPRSRGYIVVYSPPGPHIYITYILFGGLYTEVIICSKFPLVESCYFLFISGEEGYIGV